MHQIKKAAVIGSGVMGSAIAAHIANSGTPVLLLDIVPQDAKDRSELAKNALEKLKRSKPAAFTHKSKAKLVVPGNIEDDLDLLKEVDWIVEAVLEDAEIKRGIYHKISYVRQDHTIVSSNTSTIPLASLMKDMPSSFQKHFLITHFFNPPRYMRLLEIVTGPHTEKEVAENIRRFCDFHLGKGVVECNDTPGFIANRIGCYWVMTAITEAITMGLSVEEADAVMSRPIGVPKSGVFGLLDLIGIDLMPLIAKSLKDGLDKNDAFVSSYREPKVIRQMIDEGYTGRKGKGGFYRLAEGENGKKVKEVRDLKSGKYTQAERPSLESVKQAKKGLWHLVEHDDPTGKYAKEVLIRTLSYTAGLVPEVSDDIHAIDEAMRLGYNWKYGPFELIDRLREGDVAGSTWLIEQLKERKEHVPEILMATDGRSFYDHDEKGIQYLRRDGDYQRIEVDAQGWNLKEKTYGKKPVAKNASAKIWDIGDGIACFEFTTKMNSIDPFLLEMMAKSVDIVQKDFKGLIIGNDGDNFCVGANIGVLLFASNVAAWKSIHDIIKQGQDTYMQLKYAPFPVVSATAGMALGGGCELMMHSDSIVSHIETYTGLVEAGVGIVPGWGGCKEMILRHLQMAENHRLSLAQKGGMFALSLKEAFSGKGSASLLHPIRTFNTMPAVSKAFEYIALAKVSTSAEEAKEMGILREGDVIVMNRRRVLAEAKARCMQLAKQYEPPKELRFSLPGNTAKTALEMAVAGFQKSGKASEHDAQIALALASVLSGGQTDILDELGEQELLDLEREAFMNLIKTEKTLDRIEHMLETGKPLRN